VFEAAHVFSISSSSLQIGKLAAWHRDSNKASGAKLYRTLYISSVGALAQHQGKWFQALPELSHQSIRTTSRQAATRPAATNSSVKISPGVT
jgi:hypothetical protein